MAGGSIPHLLLRADASPAIGQGHVMRCLALAQAWQDAGGDATLATCDLPAGLRSRLEAERVEVLPMRAETGSEEDSRQLVSCAVERGAVVVLDGYSFGPRYQERLRTARGGGGPLLVIDDHGRAGEYFADVILDQNLGAAEVLYSRRPSECRLLLGPSFALLRREFRQAATRERGVTPAASRVLVTLGGADPGDLTAEVVRAVEAAGGAQFEVRVVIGEANPRAADIATLARNRCADIRVESGVCDMTEPMLWADIAVSAAGSTCWEMACLGLPAVVVPVSANQAPVAAALERQGVAVRVRWPNDSLGRDLSEAVRDLVASPDRRRDMSARGRTLVDGQGAARVASALFGLGTRDAAAVRRTGRLSLRRAREEDCARVWEWANDPAVREASFDSAPIPWESHVAWFRGVLENENCMLFIALDGEGREVGQIRFAVAGVEAVVSTLVGSGFRGLAYGVELIGLGSARLFSERESVTTIWAHAKHNNTASIRAFVNAGYAHAGETRQRGCPATSMVLRRGPEAKEG